MLPAPRIFEGQTAFIVAGGPSLASFPFASLEGRNLIAINRSYEVLPFAQALWWSDAIFWRNRRPDMRTNGEAILAHGATLKATLNLGYQKGELPLEILAYRSGGLEGFAKDPSTICHGNNSAFAAMNWAVHLGAKRIVLLGVDMKHGEDGKTHWHSGHGRYFDEHVLTKLMLPYFATMKPALDKRGIEVINASLDSALAIWPKVTLEEAMGL